MSPRLETKIKTDLSIQMTQQLMQALQILQLNTVELANKIQEELASNPMLVEKEDEPGEPLKPATEDPAAQVSTKEETSEIKVDEQGAGPEGIDKEEWDNFFPDDDYIIPRFDREQYTDYREPQIMQQQTLEENLLWQLRMADVSEVEFQIGEIIIGNLDDRGFLTVALDEIARQASAEVDEVKSVLEQIQTLDPVGIGARDVVESLLIQLQNLPERNQAAERIVAHHFILLEKRQFDQLGKATKLPRDEILKADKLIGSLDPFPGRRFSNEQVQYVVPDAVLEKHDDQYIIVVNDDGFPHLGISRKYKKLLAARDSHLSEQEKNFLRDQRNQAKNLIESIDKRRKTYYRVIEAIVKHQQDFFDKGIEYLKPLRLREVADEIGKHESTVSRVTNGKYIQTPRGIFELKYFFSSHIGTADGNQISSTSVKAALQELMAEENKQKPLSDQKLTELLIKKGFDIKRRTVAKYREEMNLPPASQRKILQ